MITNGTLSDGDGYDYYKVHQVYTGFFKNSELCLKSLGTLVERDRQFLLFILSYFNGFSKEFMEYIEKDNNTVYENLLKIAIIYIKTYAPTRAYKNASFTLLPSSETLALTDGSLQSVLDYDITPGSSIIVLGMYKSVLNKFQERVEECLLRDYKLVGVTSKNRTSQIRTDRENQIKKITGDITLDLTSHDSTTKLTNIYNYRNSVFNAFNNILSLFNTNTQDILNTLSNDQTSVQTKKNYIESLATTQLNIDLGRFNERLGGSNAYKSASEMYIDIITNGNIQTSFFYFCLINVIYYDAIGSIFIKLNNDLMENGSDYFNSDGTPKSIIINGETITLKSMFLSLYSGIINLFQNYYNKLIKYMSYLSIYLLGIQTTGADTTTITNLLSLPSGYALEKIRNNIYIKLIKQIQIISYSSGSTGESCGLSVDPFEMYDFAYDFDSYLKYLENALYSLQTQYSPEIFSNYLDLVVEGIRTNSNNIPKKKNSQNNFIIIIKSNFEIN